MYIMGREYYWSEEIVTTIIHVYNGEGVLLEQGDCDHYKKTI